MKQSFSHKEIQELRQQTPGTFLVAHFNNAGASLMPLQVFQPMQAYLQDELYMGGYEAADKWKDDLASVYGEIARMIHADPSEIALLESATTAWYKAFHSLNLQEGDVILCSEAEYGSNFMGFIDQIKNNGVIVRIVPSDDEGSLSLDALESMIDQRVKLIAITHIPTNGGLVNPAERVGEMAEKHGITYLLDACQSAGQYPLDVNKLKCDFLSATGRKYMRAPRGTGFLYVKKERLSRLKPVFPDLLSAEWSDTFEFVPIDSARMFENYESNRSGIIGLGCAAALINNLGIERIWNRVVHLSGLLREKLNEIPEVITTDIGRVQSGLCTFFVSDVEASEVQLRLRKENVHVSITGRGSTRIDMEKRGLEELLRASVHYFNTEEEIDKLVLAVKEIVKNRQR